MKNQHRKKEQVSPLATLLGCLAALLVLCLGTDIQFVKRRRSSFRYSALIIILIRRNELRRDGATDKTRSHSTHTRQTIFIIVIDVDCYSAAGSSSAGCPAESRDKVLLPRNLRFIGLTVAVWRKLTRSHVCGNFIGTR